MNLNKMNKAELIKLLQAYNEYIINDFEPWTLDRQPACVVEFYNNEYSEFNETYNDNDGNIIRR